MWECEFVFLWASLTFLSPKTNTTTYICTKIHLEIGTCTIYLCTFAILNKEDIYFALLHKKKNLWTIFLQNEILSMNLPLHAYIFAAVSFLKENTFLLKCFHYLSQSLKLQSISEEDRSWENHIQKEFLSKHFLWMDRIRNTHMYIVTFSYVIFRVRCYFWGLFPELAQERKHR